MKKTFLALLTFVVSTTVPFANGCSTKVNVTVKNPTKETQSVTATIKYKGSTKQEITLGTVEAGKDVKSSFDVKRNRDLVLSSSTKGYETWKSNPITITAKPNPRNVEEEINLTAQLVDEARSEQTVIDEFLKIGKNYGLLPVQAKQAVDTYLGALLLIIPPSDAGQEGEILFRVPPSEFLGVTGERPITYANTNSSYQIQITGTSALRVALIFPILSFGVAYNKESLYEVKWSLKGFGNVLVTEPDNWQVYTAVSSLPNAHKAAINQLMASNSSAVLLYVNRLYAIRDGSLSRRQGRKLSAGTSLTASTFLTNNGAWTFSETVEESKDFAEVVLNIGGEVVQATFVMISPNQPATFLGPQGSIKDLQLGFRPVMTSPSEEKWYTVDVRRTGLSVNLSPRMLKQ